MSPFPSHAHTATSLSAHNLECRRGGRTLFDVLSFKLEAGQMLQVTGANGEGKTSLLRLVAGLSTPHAGSVSWKGEDIARLGEDYRRHLVYVGHANGIKEDLTAEQTLIEWGRLAGEPMDFSRACALLEQAGLPQAIGKPVRLLSQGQSRRVALTRLLAARRPLWILDEPLAGLDHAACAAVASMLGEHLRQGGILVCTTHQALAMEACACQELKLGRR